MNIREEVDKIIRKKWSELRNPNNLISLNSIEKQTNQGYNGRQLLELFQNCEDEGATKVKILLDTKKSLLEISNDGGKPFSVNGYASIFYPGLSAKVSSGYIGNKGLGFRSIINWADKISIVSNDFKLVFDTSLKKDVLLNKIGYSEKELIQVRKERHLKADVYPLPLLNCCKLEDVDSDSEFTTTISIRYKTVYEERIIEQLKSISEKTLLFLNNINTIEIDGDVSNKTIKVTRKNISKNYSEIVHNGEVFNVISDDGVVDEELIEDKDSSEPKKYSVKIAYNNNLTFKDKVLYNYFKTQIPFELPFVAHASLELDQNRNHSTDSKVNPFILDKLFQLHLNFIEVLKNKHSKSWLPYQIVNNDNVALYKPYSDIIDNYWGNFEVYPILTGEYVNSSVAKNLGNSIANFIDFNNLENYYGEQIVYCDLSINPQQYVKKPKNYKEIIESISVGLNITQRAKFVSLLLDTYPNEKFSVLIDENDNLIKTVDFVYTDKTSENKDLQVPSYSNIRFLNSNLYKELITCLKLNSITNKSRGLKDKLETISDVHSFEPQTVIKKIISETDNYLKKSLGNKNEVIKEFYQKLFYNYKSRGNNPELDYEGTIPCLNASNQLKDINSLVLSSEFEIGKLSNIIFGKLYESDYLITSLQKLGLENENLIDVEAFLKWLGINSFSIIETLRTDADQKFITYSNSKHNININNYSLYQVKYFDKIVNDQSITINNIIAWLSLDEKINEIFTNYTKLCSDKEKISYNYYGQKYIRPFDNLIYFKLVQRFNIKDYLITNKKQEWFNPFKIDYEYLSKVNNDLDKAEVDRILTFFGAKKDFNDLSINYLKIKTQELSDKKNDKGSQVFYKSLVSHFKQNGQSILNVDLYAKEGKDIVVKNSSEIYFSDRIQLPESLTNKFPILYYPSRSGGSRAIEMFGLKNLNKLDLKIEKEEKNILISNRFENLIKEIKPFILAFRLDKITKEDVKNAQVLLINKLKIVCCKELVCSIEGEIFTIEPFNYIYKDSQFYINIPNNLSILQLKQNKRFRDNLSDIFLKVFDTLDEKKTFESIIMQSKEDNIYDVRNELAEGILEEAKILLGEISVRLSIWKTIFRLEDIDVISNLNESNIDEYILKYFPDIVKEELFNSDDTLSEVFRIRKLFNIIDVSLIDYNDISDYKLSFDKLFFKELVVFYDERKKIVKNQLWQFLSKKSKEEQSNFIRYLNKIEHLLNNFELTANSNSYNFELILKTELEKIFSFIEFDLTNESFLGYDLIENKNSKLFTDDEMLKIRRDETLNSLSYFEGHIDYIKSHVIEKKELFSDETVDESFNLDTNKESEFIVDFEIINNSNANYKEKTGSGFWLGDKGSELSSNQKKKLGNSVEEIIKKHLTDKPHLYQKVELIAKTNERAHYDIKYFDIETKEIKFVEGKYYNGTSFMLSIAEKEFGFNNLQQYEIWLVNKDSKIYAIKDIEKLGELKPINYKVEIKLKDYALKN